MLITKDNVDKYYKTFTDIPKENIERNNSNLELKDMHALEKMSYVYDLHKNNPDMLKKFFKPEQIEYFQKLDIIEKETYQRVAKQLEKD